MNTPSGGTPVPVPISSAGRSFPLIAIVLLCGVGGVAWWRYSAAVGAPSVSASPAPAALTRADVDGIVDAKIKVAVESVVKAVAPIMADHRKWLDTLWATTYGANGDPGLTGSVSQLATRLTITEQNAAARLNAEWKTQEAIAVRVAGERWSVDPTVNTTLAQAASDLTTCERQGRGWIFKKPANAKQANFDNVCAEFAKKIGAQFGLRYDGVPSEGRKTMADELFTKGKSEAIMFMDLGDEQLQGLIAALLIKQREKLHGVDQRVGKVTKTIEDLTPDDRIDSGPVMFPSPETKSATPTAVTSAAPTEPVNAGEVVHPTPPVVGTPSEATKTQPAGSFNIEEVRARFHARQSDRSINLRRADSVPATEPSPAPSPSPADGGDWVHP